MIEVQDIIKVKKNRGGLARTQIIFEKDIVSLPTHNPISLYSTGTIVLRPDARAYDVYFTKSSAKFREATSTKQGGDYSTQTIVFKSPKDRPVVRLMVERMKNNSVCIVYQDWNGQFKFVRNLRAKPITDTNGLGGYNGTTFTLTGQSKRSSGFWQYVPNPYITPTITTAEEETTPPVTPPTTTNDTNFAKDNLIFLEDRVHQLEGHILSLVGSGSMTLGGETAPSKLSIHEGDIEIVQNGYGFIMTTANGERRRLTISDHGILTVSLPL